MALFGSITGSALLAGGLTAQEQQTFTGFNEFDKQTSFNIIRPQLVGTANPATPANTDFITKADGVALFGGGGGDVLLDGGTEASPQTFTGFNKFDEDVELEGYLNLSSTSNHINQTGGGEMEFNQTGFTSNRVEQIGLNNRIIQSSTETGGSAIDNLFQQIGGTSLIKTDGTIEMAKDEAKTAILGRARIGYMGAYNDYAGFSHYDSTGAGNYALLQSTGGTTYLNCSSAGQINFRVNNGDKMRMNYIGYLGIGQSHSPSYLLDVKGIAFIRTAVFSPSFIRTSDDRIKENEKLIKNATETLLKLTPQIYDKYEDMDLSGNPRVESGLIAQEVYYNAPELRHLIDAGLTTDASGNDIKPTPDEMDLSGVDINSDPDYGSHGWGKKINASLDYEGLIAYLIKSNQELHQRILKLEAKINNM